jgi:hypothetical protein
MPKTAGGVRAVLLEADLATAMVRAGIDLNAAFEVAIAILSSRVLR